MNGTVLHTLSPEKQNLVLSHLDLVREANKSVNLTRITSREEGIVLHIEDSLSALPEINNAPSGLLGDIGSGAGYPGIPLAIATGRRTTLIDARMKKMGIMSSIIEQLGLSDQLETYAGRAELLARMEPGKYSAVTARALARLSVLLELASPLLKKHGQLVCYKAKLEEEELEHAKGVAGLVGMKLVSDRSFALCEEYERRILVFEKYCKPSISLPRREGEAQKNPL